MLNTPLNLEILWWKRKKKTASTTRNFTVNSPQPVYNPVEIALQRILSDYFFPQITWASSSSVPKTEISKWQSMPRWRIGDTQMNSSPACHGCCCWSKAGRQWEPRATQRIRAARDPFHQVFSGCHDKDTATAVLTDRQRNTAAAHHLLGGKGAIPRDQQKIVFTCFASLQEELTQLCPSRAWGSFCWCICKGVHGEQRPNEHTRETHKYKVFAWACEVDYSW